MKIERTTQSQNLAANPLKSRGSAEKESAAPRSTVTTLSHDPLAASGDVNMERVNELKNAIAEGRFAIDADRISEDIVASAIELMG